MPTTYAIPDGRVAMAATTYTGNGTGLKITTGFPVDFSWQKGRSNAQQHYLQDTVRGIPAGALRTNDTAAEGGVLVSSFDSDGVTFNGNGNTNTLGYTYVAWLWKAGGTAVSNTAGSITSSVSANTTAGFSVVTYTGTGANATVGHGLGVAPAFIIGKKRSAAGSWQTYVSAIPNMATGYIVLNGTGAWTSNSTIWNGTAPTSTVFSLGTDTDLNANGATNVAYCFAPVAGYSAFGSYTGNGSADGPFVYLGFRPRWVMVKDVTSSSAGAHWFIWDSSRNTYNLTDNELVANGSYAENVPDANATIDILSNGFKFRGGNAYGNVSGNTNIYAAFAENPFKYANAR
jgi:hypothetical protein